MIPKKIYQTWQTKSPPFKMSQAMESWKQKNSKWEYTLFDSDDRVEFIKNHFEREVLDAYQTLLPPAFQADLWRYCVLYINGGVYADADMICEVSLDEWISSDFVVVRDDPMAFKWLANGFIATFPKNPCIREIINRIVQKCRNKQLEFYLDYTGPALWGKVVNKYLGENEENDYLLGLYKKIQVLKHDYSTTKFTNYDKPVIHVEYKEYRNEMKEIGNEPFFNFVQREEIFREIPKQIIWTTFDELDINDYMVESYKSKNPLWEIKYFSQEDVDKWFENSIYFEPYKKLSQRGEKTDFFRYCYLYENGGVYVDADTYCNQPLDDWISSEDLIVGLEANTPKNIGLGFENFGQLCNEKWISVCNWAFATKPKHPVISEIINDIINNPNDGVIKNTGPGRFTKWIINYFGRNNNFDDDVVKGKSKLLSINRFGSNQSHSNSIKKTNPFENNDRIFITHFFDGKWRINEGREKIKIIESDKKKGISHNMTIRKTEDGFFGLSRWDVDTSRTEFMKNLGDCRYVNQLFFDNKLNLKKQEVRKIENYETLAKFEDFRHFTFQNKIYYSVSYINKNWNTRVGILDENYNFIGRIEIENINKISFGVGDVVEWEKNWLFFEHNDSLFFIYSTTPKFIIYKCIDLEKLIFEKIKETENNFDKLLPINQLYFSKNISTGGSTNPIWIEEKNQWVYLIHTKLYDEKRYNHYLVYLDVHLDIVKVSDKPTFSNYINFDYFFISTMIRNGDDIIISGGVSDKDNFIWKIPIYTIIT